MCNHSHQREIHSFFDRMAKITRYISKSFAFSVVPNIIFACAVALAMQIVGASLTSATDCLQQEHMMCDNDRCVPNTKICDGQSDCEDLTDEYNCDAHLCLSPDWFRCNNTKCVKSDFVCDSENDCGDWSDERECPDFAASAPVASNCSTDEWRCLDRLCISLDWVCNGERDCLDGSDEVSGCKELRCSGFRCKSGQCIEKEWKCDGTNDCRDGSDEENCQVPVKLDNCTSENDLYLCKDGLACIPIGKYCDGTEHCADRSDEPANCSAACAPLGCSHGCIVYPSHAKCRCLNGYVLTNDTACTDMDECKIYGICDQKCRNGDGSYECYCDRNYDLQKDRRTCKAPDSDPLLVFSSKTEVRGFYLNSDLYYPIAKDLKQAIGVAYDGLHVYWTEIFGGQESIVRSRVDGTHKEVVVSAGLSAPEDLAVDWVTKNIYFTDAEVRHIGVCLGSGLYCTVLISESVHKPRGIVLDSMDGKMYWSDWGRRPEIGRSSMDGTEDISFVSNNIHWPNGLALDRPNRRLYWTDAKLMTLESVNLDGYDRHVILEGIAKHPYGLALFEDRIYWSDLTRRSVESCDKFTGKDHHVLVKHPSQPIYGLHVYHPAMRPRRDDPCALGFCSDICLLRGRNGYSCACPLEKELGPDRHTCQSNTKNQTLIVGTAAALFAVQYRLLGRHGVTELPIGHRNVTAVAYDSLNHSVFLSDASTASIVRMSLHDRTVARLPTDSDFTHVLAMDFDPLGNNLYWCNAEKATVEVLSLNTMSRRVLIKDTTGEVPTALALVPTEGYMFVAFQATVARTAHIDRFRMDGSDRRHVHERKLLGPIRLAYDRGTHRIFWADPGTGNIETSSVDGDERHTVLSTRNSPIGIASLSRHVAWINQRSRNIYFVDKSAGATGPIKNQSVDAVGSEEELIHLVSVTPPMSKDFPRLHPCQLNNGNCSHICLIFSNDTAACACPVGFRLEPGNDGTCSKSEHCGLDEFRCDRSDLCVPRSARCDGHKDCMFGEDEGDCGHVTGSCGPAKYRCRNGHCIDLELACDMHYDCVDKSDEENCDRAIGCLDDQFMCRDGRCIEQHLSCDGRPHCEDGSDELGCGNATCNAAQFRCASGSCIPKFWECDQEINCPDASDEHKRCSRFCHAYASCKPPSFLCDNGLCIEAGLKCNGINECGDYSDESACPSEGSRSASAAAADCLPHEFRCYRGTSPCLPGEVRCNGTSECPQHEDERGCANCHLEEFECDNRRCIPTQWLCDGANDCGDRSDERPDLCLHERNAALQQQQQQHRDERCEEGFRCQNKRCIGLRSVCDGMDDCGDESDEGGACSTSCSSDNNPCSQICVRTPSGSRCGCSTGYRLRGDGHTCVDVQECLAEPPVCGQICHEKPGSFSCDCYKGYMLRPDQRSCKSRNEPMSLIFAASGKIYRVSQTNNTLEVLYSGEGAEVTTGVDVSTTKGYLYFTTAEPGRLHRIHLRSRAHEYLDVMGRPETPAVDWISENVYFVNNDVDRKFLYVCSFGRSYCTIVVDLNGYNGKVTALTVDGNGGHLFYAVSDWRLFNSPSAAIYRRNLDGSDPQEITKSSASYVSGLTYDPYKNLLYYANSHLEKVFKVKDDGTNALAIISDLASPTSLAIFEDQLYFHSSQGYLTTCPLFGDYQECRNVKVHGNFSNLFVIVQVSRQLAGEDACKDDVSCQNMCVRTGNTKQCLCDSQKLNYKHEWCQHKQIKSTKGSLTGGETGPDGKPSRITTAVVINVILMLLIVFGIYCYVRNKRSSGNLDIGIRFHNPIYEHVGEDSHSQSVPLEPGQLEYYNPTEFPRATANWQAIKRQDKPVF